MINMKYKTTTFNDVNVLLISIFDIGVNLNRILNILFYFLQLNFHLNEISTRKLFQ